MMIALWLSLAALACSQPHDTQSTSAPPASVPSAKEPATDLLRAVPPTLAEMVGSLCDRPLKRDVPVRVVTTKELEDALLNDFRAQAIANGAKESEVKDLPAEALLTVGLQSGRLFAYYSYSAKAIMVHPLVLDSLIAAGVVPEAEQHRVVALAVAHEYVHALQDQEIGLAHFMRSEASMSPIERKDRTLARRAVCEGHAMLAQELIGEALAKSDPAWAPAVAAMNKIAPGATHAAGDGDRVQEEMVYRGGLSVVRATHKAGGNAAVWKLYADPPKSLSAFSGAVDNSDPELAADIARRIGLLGESAKSGAGSTQPPWGTGWQSRALPSSPALGLRQALAMVPADKRPAILADIRSCAALLGQTAAGGRLSVTVVVTVPQGPSPETLPALKTLLDMAKAAVLGANPTVTNVTKDDFTTVAEATQQRFDDKSELNAVALQGSKGPIWVYVFSINGGHDANAARTIAEAVLKVTEEAVSARTR